MSAEGKSDQKISSDLFLVTPLIESDPLEKILGLPVFLKMENCQPTGSFKIRGLSRLVKTFVDDGNVEVMSSSGGNAGMAVAYTARKLGVKAHLVVPTRTSNVVVKRLQQEGAQVYVHGKFWNESNEKAIEMAEKIGCPYVHPAEHPTIWAGHATMMEEIRSQLPPEYSRPGAVVASIGYGGLLLGVLQGMAEAGWNDVPVIAMETFGAHSFHEAVKAGKVVTLPEITSIATTLGSATVSEKLIDYLNDRGSIFSEVLTDKEAVDACLRFADDHRVLVEPSCGVSLASIYSGTLSRLAKEGKLRLNAPVIIIVCGGSGVHLEQLQQWKKMFDL